MGCTTRVIVERKLPAVCSFPLEHRLKMPPVSHRFDNKFIRNEGWEFRRDNVSVRLLSPSCGQAMTDDQVIKLYEILETFMLAIDGEPKSSAFMPVSKVLSRDDFGVVTDQPLYKYVSASTWQHIQRGSFQFGSAEYYRRAENTN
jgi:hypothetical protein